MAALPAKYAEALRLRDQGIPVPEIAARLDVPLASATALMRLAEAKLARLLAGPDEPGDIDGRTGS